VPGQRLKVGAQLRVDALLLALRVEVAEPQLHQGQVGDHSLVDGGLPFRSGVEPVDPQELATEPLGRVCRQRADELLGGDAVLAPGTGVQQQRSGGGVQVTRVDENRVAGGLRNVLRCSHGFQPYSRRGGSMARTAATRRVGTVLSGMTAWSYRCRHG
jgi:hypothetical protein